MIDMPPLARKNVTQGGFVMNIALFVGMAERLPREVHDAELDLRARSNALRYRKLVAEAVDALRGSWADSDGRLYRPHWFFVKAFVLDHEDRDRTKIKCYEKFWPREIVNDRAEAERKRPGQIGTLADCAEAGCSGCGKSAPVIGRLVHDGDHAQDDSWKLDLYALCGTCAALTDVATDFKTDTHY